MKKLFIGLIALTVFVGSAVAMEAPRTVKLEIENQSDYTCFVYSLERRQGKQNKHKKGRDISPYKSSNFELNINKTVQIEGFLIKHGIFYAALDLKSNFVLHEFNEPGTFIMPKEIGRINNPTDVLLIINPDGSLCLVDRSGMEK